MVPITKRYNKHMGEIRLGKNPRKNKMTLYVHTFYYDGAHKIRVLI